MPPEEGQVSESREVSLRDSIDSAVALVESPQQESAPSQLPAVREERVTERSEPARESTNVVDLNKPQDFARLTEKPAQQKQVQVEPAPRAWKASAQAKWSSLPAEVRQEVQRRENEVARVFGETGQMRQAVATFNDIVRPYEGRMRAVGLSPLEAVNELMKADHILSSSPPQQRAAYMALLIKEYGVDIRLLDDALAGQAPSADPVQTRLEQMLSERLTPLQSFLQNQANIAAQQEYRIQADASMTIEQMSQDNINFPYFEQVREDMADIIEMNARRQVYLTPQQAYGRAVAMNPEWGAQMAQQAQNGRQLQQAHELNTRAQRALNASSSVSGGPSGSPVGGANQGNDLRATIEAAFSQVAGR
jgi:hypothetical protein